jgi:hypothetical protein
VLGVLALGVFLVYHFTVHTIVNRRPVAAPNVNVSPVFHPQTEASFAVDPSSPRVLFGASNDAGGETVLTYTSTDGGTTWKRAAGPVVPGGSCARGEPRVALGGGRQYLAFLGGLYCGDNLTPYLLVTSRAGPADRWSRLVRVAPPTWKYGYDDGPALAVDRASGRVYLAWTRGLSAKRATIVVSSSTDEGRTWSPPAEVSDALDHPHLASLATGPGGALYAAGIDAKVGVWVSHSVDGGRTFSPPRAAGRLIANPAGSCSLAAQSPLPQEGRTCGGPNPAVNVTADRVFVVYGDVGANQSPDVFVGAFDHDLKPLFRAQVNPPETSKASQFFPASAVDPTTGVLWACWYDTTFDPNAHRAWFTCSASRDGKTWGVPQRASSDPTGPGELYAIAGQHALQPTVAAAGGAAHAFWIDGRIVENEFDVFTAAIPQGPALSSAR